MKAEISLAKIKELKPGMTMKVDIPGEIGEEITLPSRVVKKLISLRDDIAGIQVGEQFKITDGDREIIADIVD